MNRTLINLYTIIISLTIVPSIGLSLGKKSNGDSPVVFLTSETYMFEPVMEGVTVVHDFIIQNRGKSNLKILSVNPGCSCTTASYSKEIPPGEKGKITLSLNSTGYGGSTVNKNIYVETNDPDHESFILTFSGYVESFVTVEPSIAVLSGSVGDDIKVEISIIPNKKTPFKIIRVRTREGNNIKAKLKEVKGTDGLQYILIVTNLLEELGKYYDAIFITTDNPSYRLSIHVRGEIQ